MISASIRMTSLKSAAVNSLHHWRSLVVLFLLAVVAAVIGSTYFGAQGEQRGSDRFAAQRLALAGLPDMPDDAGWMKPRRSW